MSTKLGASLQLTLIYGLLAGTWIIGSDTYVALSQGGPVSALLINGGKGLFFVLISSLVLYRLAVRMERRVRTAEQERSRTEREATLVLARVNQFYMTLARANEVALTAENRGTLCHAICQMLIEHAGMRLACIGWVHESTQLVRFETIVGPAAAYAQDLVISVDANRPDSRGPTGMAIRQQQTVVSEDVASDTRMGPWRERASAHGLRSSATVPLQLRDGTRGALAIYSGERNFFSRELLSLAEKLAADLTHGLEVLLVRERLAAQTAALRESERRWQFALEGAGDGVWDLDVATGEMYFSARLARMFGYEPSEFMGRIEEWEARVHPDDLARARAQVVACLTEGREVLHEEYRVRCRDGSYRWILGRGKVLERAPDGKPSRLIGTITDLTAVRRTSQRLALLQAAVQAVPAGIVITDRSGKIEWVNDGFTTLTGYSAEEAIGQNPRVLKSGNHAPDFYAELWRTILRGEVWSGELVNRRKDGTEYAEHMIIAPVSHDAADTTHFVAIKQDITERRQIERQLLRAQRMEGIGLLAGGLAHDLNNVLAPISLSVELLRLRCADPADKRTLEVIEAAARRGSGIVRQVLTFARGIDGERTPLRPSDLVRELVLMIEETFPRTIEILRDVAEDTPMVRGDTTQLHQVLLNLAVNARDAMPNGGRLVFSARGVQLATKQPSDMGEIPPGAYVQLSVRDSGEGMAPDVRERIFEPFFTTKPRGKGTGLGLPTVLGIVRSHGGFLQVDSQPGEGSEFRIFLPAMAPERTASNPPIPMPDLRGGDRLVLVCDDETAVRETAGVVLAQAGFRVVEARHGREALEVFANRSNEIAAVLMDIMMPLMTGDRAAAAMLQTRPALPLVLMSGLMEHDTVQAALGNISASHAPVLLRKPFTAQELLGVIGRALERQSERADS